MFGRVLVRCVLLVVLNFVFGLGFTAPRRPDTVADIELDEEQDTVSLQACFEEDLRNIRAHNPNPLHVIINHCYLQELPNAIFIRFHDLKSLQICDSRLNHLQDFALNGLRNLEVLDFSRNNLTTVKSWSDHSLENLQSLDLRRNLLNKVNTQSFKHYPNLTKLNLAVNQIAVIPEGTFQVAPHLKYLNLAHNLLTSIDETTLKGLTKLNHVYFHHNQITFVDFFAFVGNSHLKTLQLQENKISVLETDLLSNLPRLTFLNISHNQLEIVSENSFKRSASLRSLDMSYNRIKNFHEDSLKGLSSLEVFNASHNQLNQLNKYMFKDFSAVEVLVLVGNQLAYVENKLFEYSPQVKILNLSRNVIADIEPEIFEDTIRLHSLDLSQNQLVEDAFLGSLPHLQCLNLNHNLFQRLNVSLLGHMGHVELRGNPWRCQFLILELMKQNHNIHYANNYVVQSADSILNTHGIGCTDENGKSRDIIVVESPAKQDYSSLEYHRYRLFHEAQLDTRPIQDNFDTKSTILWLMSGAFVVFGAFKLIQLILQHSEHQSEKWRLDQHMECNEAGEIDDDAVGRLIFPASATADATKQ
ncbi:insulin-like growth factor-binding protein complex acid labile subunit [Malaya genurostris]|uniref:insulin-like growth factor-binding protein complex acid labile subunit n=1 Tax=Malaya genurostris TaxID=325434 RepID=UPI0026F3F51B|nr:insulin-like growth factor-binding protein complex acid labile subunit [Malaya genurostris]